MKIVKIISFICVLALAVSMCSMFSFAAAPETEKEDQTRASNYFRVPLAASVYGNSNLSGSAIYSVSRGDRLDTESTSGWSYSSGSWEVSRNGVSGYISKKSIIPAEKCYKVNYSGYYLYTGANGQDKVLSSAIPVGTYLCVMGTDTIGNTLWRLVRVYRGTSSIYTGWMLASCMGHG